MSKSIPKPWPALVSVALRTGVRFGEQLRLKWEDIDTKQKVPPVRESSSAKTQDIPLYETAMSTLEAIHVGLNRPQVFYNKDGGMSGTISACRKARCK